MNEAEFKARRAVVLREEMAEPLRWMYLSFADDARGGFQGAVVVEARGMMHALMTCNGLDINPGGEVMAMVLPPDKVPATEWRNRLLGHGDVEAAFGGPAKTLRELEEEEGLLVIKLG